MRARFASKLEDAVRLSRYLSGDYLARSAMRHSLEENRELFMLRLLKFQMLRQSGFQDICRYLLDCIRRGWLLTTTNVMELHDLEEHGEHNRGRIKLRDSITLERIIREILTQTKYKPRMEKEHQEIPACRNDFEFTFVRRVRDLPPVFPSVGVGESNSN